MRQRVLAGFRSRRQYYDWREIEGYVDIALASVENLREAAGIWGASAVIPTAQEAIAATIRVIHHADDSNGSVGMVVGELLDLHADLCTVAPPDPKKLVDWLIRFQFDGSQDFFNPDVANYADSLGAAGLTLFGDRLQLFRDKFGPETEDYNWNRTLVALNFQRLAVARRDPQALIASFGDLSRSYRLHDLAKALIEIDEIDEIDLATEYAALGGRGEDGWQAERCALYWCELVAQHRAHTDEVDARTFVFGRWPTASNALRLAEALGDDWVEVVEDAYEKLLARSPRDLIETLLGLGVDD